METVNKQSYVGGIMCKVWMTVSSVLEDKKDPDFKTL